MASSDTVLPTSRQPKPLDAKVQAEYDRRRTRTPDEIEADIAERTDRLAANIDQLVSRVAPANLARSGVASMRSTVTNANGSVRLELVGAAVGALVVAGALAWWSRRRG